MFNMLCVLLIFLGLADGDGGLILLAVLLLIFFGGW
jgi:hypothetical protein